MSTENKIAVFFFLFFSDFKLSIKSLTAPLIVSGFEFSEMIKCVKKYIIKEKNSEVI